MKALMRLTVLCVVFTSCTVDKRISEGRFQKRRINAGWHVDLHDSGSSHEKKVRKATVDLISDGSAAKEFPTVETEADPIELMAASNSTDAFVALDRSVPLSKKLAWKTRMPGSKTEDASIPEVPKSLMKAEPDLQNENEKVNGMAPASLGLAILGWISLFAFFSWLSPALIVSALALGIIAIVRINKRGGKGKGSAIAAIILCGVFVLLLVVLVIAVSTISLSLSFN